MKRGLCTFAAGLALLAAPALAAPVLNPGNGHYYEYVPSGMCWDAARLSALSLTHAGFPGHLVTITSASENSFIVSNFATGSAATLAWIGAHEPADDGVWRWGTGPEAGTQFSLWAVPVAPLNYANWGGIEPNDAAANEYCSMNLGLTFANIIQTGQWVDDPPCPGGLDPIVGFIVEYEPDPVAVERSEWGSLKASFR